MIVPQCVWTGEIFYQNCFMWQITGGVYSEWT